VTLLVVSALLLAWMLWPRQYMCSECFGYAIERREGYLSSSVCYCFNCQRFTDMMRTP